MEGNNQQNKKYNSHPFGMGEDICKWHWHSDKKLVSKICKELIKLNTQKSNPVKKLAGHPDIFQRRHTAG